MRSLVKNPGASIGTVASSQSRILFLTTLLAQLYSGIVGIVVPIYAYELGASPLLIGVVGAAGAVTYSIMPVVFGRLSDKIGRKRMLLSSMILYGVVCILYILSRGVFDVIAIRVLESVSLAILWPTLEALIVDVYAGESVETALRLYNVAWGSALIVAPGIGGMLITALTVKAPFYLACAISFLVCLPVLRVATVAKVAGSNPDPPRGGWEVPRETWAAVISAYLLSFVMGILMTLFPAFALSLNFLAVDVGVVLLVFGVGREIMFYFTTSIERRVQKEMMLLLSGLIFIGTMLVVAIFPSFPVFLACFGLLGFGTGMAFSASISMMMHTGASKRGSAAGKFESLMGLGSLTGPILAGAVAEIDGRGPFFLGSGVSAAVSLALVGLKRKRASAYG